MKVLRISYNEYLKQFKYISSLIDPALLFKVDIIESNNKFLTFYNIHNRALIAVNLISLNTIEIKSLISSGGGAGSHILQYVIKKYSNRYNIILDSFKSNNAFYLKNNFIPYKESAYNPLYDPDGLNINKESVIYYKYNKSGGGLNE